MINRANKSFSLSMHSRLLAVVPLFAYNVHDIKKVLIKYDK
jgi:hypothetical protein